jgi:ribose transport system permease protein
MPSGPVMSRVPMATRSPDPSRRDLRAGLKRVLSFEELGVATALVVMVLVIGAFHSNFLQKNVLLDTLQTASFVAIIAYGMVFLLTMSEIDLSVGGTYALSIITTAKLMSGHGMNPWVAILPGIGIAAFLGAVNGVLASLLRLPLIIITLGTLSAYGGLATVVSNGQPVQNLPINSSFFTELGGNWLGFPAAAWVALVLLVSLTVVFTKTRFGTMVRAIGSNHQAATFSGIPAGRIRFYAITMTGALAGVSGVLSLAYFQGADPTLGTGLELQVIAAAIIGGTAVSGGTGTVPGALLGALIVAVINSALVFFAIPTNWSDVVTGAVILLAVGTDSFLRRRRAARAVRGA